MTNHPKGYLFAMPRCQQAFLTTSCLCFAKHYTQLFLRGLPHLTKFMPPPKKVFRHLTQDPTNEPDFDAISLIAPLPSDDHFGRPLKIEDIVQFCRETGRNEEQLLQQFRVLLLTRGDEIIRQRIEALR